METHRHREMQSHSQSETSSLDRESVAEIPSSASVSTSFPSTSQLLFASDARLLLLWLRVFQSEMPETSGAGGIRSARQGLLRLCAGDDRRSVAPSVPQDPQKMLSRASFPLERVAKQRVRVSLMLQSASDHEHKFVGDRDSCQDFMTTFPGDPGGPGEESGFADRPGSEPALPGRGRASESLEWENVVRRKEQSEEK